MHATPTLNTETVVVCQNCIQKDCWVIVSDTSPNVNRYITNMYAKLAQTITWPIQLTEYEYFK